MNKVNRVTSDLINNILYNHQIIKPKFQMPNVTKTGLQIKCS